MVNKIKDGEKEMILIVHSLENDNNAEVVPLSIAVGAFSKWVGKALGGAPFKIAGGPQTLKYGPHVNFDSYYGP